jgi:hypothetical protein
MRLNVRRSLVALAAAATLVGGAALPAAAKTHYPPPGGVTAVVVGTTVTVSGNDANAKIVINVYQYKKKRHPHTKLVTTLKGFADSSGNFTGTVTGLAPGTYTFVVVVKNPTTGKLVTRSFWFKVTV